MSGPGNAVPAMAGTGPGSDCGPRHPRKTRADCGDFRPPARPARMGASSPWRFPAGRKEARPALASHARPLDDHVARQSQQLAGAIIGCGYGQRRRLVLRRVRAGAGLRTRRIQRHLDARRQRRVFPGSAGDHRCDGEARHLWTSRDGGRLRSSWMKAGGWASAGGAAV